MKLHVSAFIGHFKFHIFLEESIKLSEGLLMKRCLCFNSLITLFLVQMICVNNENVVSSRKYRDTGIVLGDA